MSRGRESIRPAYCRLFSTCPSHAFAPTAIAVDTVPSGVCPHRQTPGPAAIAPPGRHVRRLLPFDKCRHRAREAVNTPPAVPGRPSLPQPRPWSKAAGRRPAGATGRRAPPPAGGRGDHFHRLGGSATSRVGDGLILVRHAASVVGSIRPAGSRHRGAVTQHAPTRLKPTRHDSGDTDLRSTVLGVPAT